MTALPGFSRCELCQEKACMKTGRPCEAVEREYLYSKRQSVDTQSWGTLMDIERCYTSRRGAIVAKF